MKDLSDRVQTPIEKTTSPPVKIMTLAKNKAYLTPLAKPSTMIMRMVSLVLK